MVQTTSLHSGSQRVKLRLISQDIGEPLDKIKSLYQFLCVMYDACVGKLGIIFFCSKPDGKTQVQRNLYRKCKILHRDISDNNIMIAPANPGFKKHCAGRYYNEVKYINQILAKDRCETIVSNAFAGLNVLSQVGMLNRNLRV
jgi:hypothetical protein